MNLEQFEKKHVRITDTDGNTFTGLASYGNYEFLMHEYGGEEDGIFIEDVLIYRSQISSIEEIEVHGTAELSTERMTLRRYCPEDVELLHRYLGTDPAMVEYSGWNPYETPEMARETVQRFIDSYADEHFYGWVLDVDDILVGTIGAYDFQDDQIEVGLSIRRDCWGRGYATEALQAVLDYLTENEGISCVTAWCAAENFGSRRAMEKSGMQLVRVEKDALKVGEKTHNKLFYEYRVNRGGDSV